MPDQSIALPSSALADTAYIGYCVRFTALVDIPVPVAGYVTIDVTLRKAESVDDADLTYYGGDEGVPTNDTDPIGGDPDTGAELVQTTPDILISSIPVATVSDQVYRGIGYRKNESGSGLTEAAMYNRAGALLNTGSGAATIVGTHADDTGDVRITGKVDDDWIQEDITADGTTQVTGEEIWDASTVYRYEYLVGGVAAIPNGPITVEIDGQVTAVIWGGAMGNVMSSAEWELAVATAVNTALTAANRKTDPTGVTAFSRAVSWPD